MLEKKSKQCRNEVLCRFCDFFVVVVVKSVDIE